MFESSSVQNRRLLRQEELILKAATALSELLEREGITKTLGCVQSTDYFSTRSNWSGSILAGLESCLSSCLRLNEPDRLEGETADCQRDARLAYGPWHPQR